MVLGVAYVVVPPSGWSELLLYRSAVLIMVLAAWWGWRHSAAADRRFALLVTLALGAFLAGELIWWAYRVQGLDPYPSLADVAFLLGYLPLAAAAAALAAGGRHDRDRSRWLDAGILTAVAGLIVWQVLMEPHVGDPSVSFLDTAVTLAYPLADLIVLGYLLVFLFSRAARDRRSDRFTAGVIAMLTADLVFSYQSLQGTYVEGGLLDLGWIIGYVLIGAAAVTAPDRTRKVGDGVEVGRGRLLGTLLVVLVPQGVIVMKVADLQAFGLDTMSAAIGVAVVTLVLVSLRMWDLAGQARAVEQRRGEKRLSTIIHHSADVVFLVDRDHCVSFASPVVVDLAEVEPEACVGMAITSWFPEDPDSIVRQLESLALMPSGAVAPLEGRFVSATGSRRFVEGTACNLLGDPDVNSFAITLRDVTVRRELEEQLERRAFHDELTGLANRALFADRVTHALSRTIRAPMGGLAVVFIDLDDFKAVNDGMGHAVGDELLVKVADRLRQCFRPADTIARFGGDEFAILLEDVTSSDQAYKIAERAVEVLRLPMDVSDISLSVPASVGIAFAVPDSTTESLMRDADIAMYSAKAHGKSRVVVFDGRLREAASDRLTLKVELPQALPAGQFTLVYQPIHDTDDAHTLRGFEALIRWNHPTRGHVPPLDFIPLAEETGDIIDIGCWVLEQACHQAAAWNNQSTSPLTMAVNVSAVQLRDPRFVAEVRQVLDSTGLSGSLLTLELTESVLIEHQDVEVLLHELRSLGVGIAIDDFGTGYSSLSYLRRFPVTSVKIDRSFINELASSHDVGLVKSIIQIAEALGLTTIAEGVETNDQLDLLAAIDCHLAQGFYLGRPQPREQIDELLMRPPGQLRETMTS